MNPLKTLRELGRATAQKVAAVAGVDLTEVYVALVAAEARGLCRVEVTHDHKRVAWIEWVAA